MLEQFRGRPRTVKDVASAIDLPVTKLYYHVRLLEEHGLIQVAETRVVSGIIEKSYLASAYRFTVDRALLPGSGVDNPALDVLLSIIFEEAASEIRQSVESGLIDVGHDRVADGGLMLGRIWTRMTAEQAQALSDAITETVKRFDIDRGDVPDDAMTFEVLIGIYPTRRGDDTTSLERRTTDHQHDQP
jgi:hypothetical protein